MHTLVLCNGKQQFIHGGPWKFTRLQTKQSQSEILVHATEDQEFILMLLQQQQASKTRIQTTKRFITKTAANVCPVEKGSLQIPRIHLLERYHWQRRHQQITMCRLPWVREILDKAKSIVRFVKKKTQIRSSKSSISQVQRP
ncbi:hypothetical protein BDL97_12G089500 [Sphagnum fallax]|jgi:hypothetical protein|nr:hypothetical protein BDL97_12G089500 [Sphagnum fallax]